MNEQALPNLSATLRYTVFDELTGVPRFGSVEARFGSISLRRSSAYDLDNNSCTGTVENAGSATYQRESANASRSASIIRCIRWAESDWSDASSNPSRIFKAINAVIPCPLGGHSKTRYPR